VRVFKEPVQMEEPVVTKGADASTLKISWTPMYDIEKTGGRDIEEYDL